MNEIIVQGSRIIVDNTLQELESYLPEGKKVIIITEEQIIRHYPTPGKYPVISITGGEENKTLQTIHELTSRLLELEADRDTFLLGIGGGIVCDITGFIASIYMRGCSFGLVPTTLLAQVDAGIGGKNGVNYNGYKNILGVIRQPEFVFCAINMLSTLPRQIFLAGFSEIVKVAVLADPRLFAYLELHAEMARIQEPRILETIIYNAIKIKAAIVNQDEKETGTRRLLNLGHTFAHAIEKNSHLSHGEAVSIGLCMISRHSCQQGLLPQEDLSRIKRLLERFALPTRTDIPEATLRETIRKDKKREGSFLYWIVPLRVGTCEIQKIKLDPPRHITLIGFMGSGKTTVGTLLATRLRQAFRDTDSVLEKQHGKSIREIFPEIGEPAFRVREKAVLEKLLASDTPSVIACGGGIILDESNRKLLKEKSIVVWLQADPADCVKRLDISSRPLLAQSHHPGETAKTIFEKRVKYYAETASLSIACETLSPTKICNLIYEKINHEL